MNLKKQLKTLTDLDKDDLLDAIGLQTRQTTADWLIPTLSAFSVGVLVGVGVGLMIAPKPGVDLRDDLRSRLGRGQEGLGSVGAGGQEKIAPPRSL